MGSYSDESDEMERKLSRPLVGDHFPYRAYYSTTDREVRANHLALEKLGLSGTNIYNAEDPVWKKFRPPWDIRCRCAWSPISIRQAARRGVKEAQEWLERSRQMTVEHGGEASQYYELTKPNSFQFVEMPAFEPPPAFLRD